MKPVGPVIPVIPVQPVSPVKPVAPVAPVALVGPVYPVQPVGPVAPVLPVAPVFTAEPGTPCKPVGPVAPRDVKVVLIFEAGSLINTEMYLPFVLVLTGITVYTSTKIFVPTVGRIVKGTINDCVTNACDD